MGTPSCETLADNAVSCPHNLAGPSDPGSCGILLPAPKRLQKKPDPVRPNPHRKALQRTASPRSRTPHYEQPCSRQPSRAFADPRGDAGHMAQRDAFNAKPADAEGKLGRAQRHRRVVQYLRKRVSYATISVTHSGTSTGRLAQRERRCLTSTRSQVQILYRPPLKSQVRHYSRLTFSFSGKSRASKCPTNSRQSATQASRQYALPIKMDADLRRRPKTSARPH